MQTWIKRGKLLLIAVLLMAVFAYVLAFALLNQTAADIDFVFFELHQIGVELSIIVSFILGGLVGLLSASLLLFRSYRKNKRLSKQYTQHLG